MTTTTGDTGPEEVQIRDIATGAILARAQCEDAETRIQKMSFSNDGHFLIAKAGGGTQLKWRRKITVWDARSGLVNARSFLDESEGRVSPDGKWVALPNETGVDIVETISGTSHGTLHKAGDYDRGWTHYAISWRHSSGRAAFAPDSGTIFVAGFDHGSRPSLLDKWVPARFDPLRGKREGRVARLWEVESGRELAAFAGCHSALFSPDGRLLATRQDDDIRIWNLPIRKPLAPILVGASIVWLALLAGVRIVRWWLPRALRTTV
jgi:WD40 repeat protein